MMVIQGKIVAIDRPPHLVVISGPNGAGKSTAAPELLSGALGVSEFVNADVIAQGLSAFQPEKVAIQAGRIMLTRLKQLAADRVDFAFETTLASRSLAPWIGGLVNEGYRFHLIFLWLPLPEMAVNRVASRVQAGGHFVPDDVVRRRYLRGIHNFLHLYRPLASTWRIYESAATPRRMIASGGKNVEEIVHDRLLWDKISSEEVYESQEDD